MADRNLEKKARHGANYGVGTAALAADPKTATQWIDEMVEDVTLDRFYDRDPKTVTLEDRREVLRILRKDRARFATTQEAAQYKRRTGEDLVKPEGETDDDPTS